MQHIFNFTFSLKQLQRAFICCYFWRPPVDKSSMSRVRIQLCSSACVISCYMFGFLFSCFLFHFAGFILMWHVLLHTSYLYLFPAFLLLFAPSFPYLPFGLYLFFLDDQILTSSKKTLTYCLSCTSKNCWMITFVTDTIL